MTHGAAYTAREAFLHPPEPSRAEIARDQLDHLVAKLLPSVLRDAARLYPADAFAQAAWIRLGWTRGGDPLNACIAEAALDVLRPDFGEIDTDVWQDCIEQGALTTHTGALAARRLYREARQRDATTTTAHEAHAA